MKKIFTFLIIATFLSCNDYDELITNEHKDKIQVDGNYLKNIPEDSLGIVLNKNSLDSTKIVERIVNNSRFCNGTYLPPIELIDKYRYPWFDYNLNKYYYNNNNYSGSNELGFILENLIYHEYGIQKNRIWVGYDLPGDPTLDDINTLYGEEVLNIRYQESQYYYDDFNYFSNFMSPMNINDMLLDIEDRVDNSNINMQNITSVWIEVGDLLCDNYTRKAEIRFFYYH